MVLNLAGQCVDADCTVPGQTVSKCRPYFTWPGSVQKLSYCNDGTISVDLLAIIGF